ncbi:MAG: formate/nitrite transporter family protein [Halobacteriovoraceae bacterium]|nr:formate/nitrite transporter family protein [Halobacteriovoraceae bacterium]MCB9095514.1 formate/nitrite transporter family protein [Halobacteriovoraceae bacterium]
MNSRQVDLNRREERKKENKKYIPVIIKRSDFVVRHPDDILEMAVHEGIQQYRRPTLSLFLSAAAAGLILGFAAMSVAFAIKLSIELSIHGAARKLIMAFFYPLGFIICILSGTQLFTEHTATAVYPVLDNKAPWHSIFRLWCITLFGNLLGTLTSSLLINMGSAVVQLDASFIYIASYITQYNSIEIFISGILAGWLMAQGGWLVLATPPNFAQIVCIYLSTFLIGIGGFHHSIVGSAELFSAYFIDDYLNIGELARVLIFSIFGNLVGGSIFVGILNYAHIRKTQISNNSKD